ncbi:MAG: CBS domain-containing protein [Candidatus Diapherotrites archaeon]
MYKAIYFYYLDGKPIVDASFKKIGVLHDLVIADGVERAEVLALVFVSGGVRKKIEWRFVESIEHQVFLNAGIQEIPIQDVNENDLLVREILLDKQLVDVDGLKVVRVNDLILVKEEGKFWITGVGVGTRGFIRRLGLEKRLWHVISRLKEIIIPWQNVDPLDPKSSIKLKVSRTKLSEVHPADLADMMDSMTATERSIIFESLDEKKAAATLAQAKPAVQKTLVRGAKAKQIENAIRKMQTDEIVDLVQLVSREDGARLLNAIDPKIAVQVKKLLTYSKESAGSLMTTTFISIPKNFTAQQTIDHLRKTLQDFHRTYYIYVIDEENHLVGSISLRKLIITAPEKTIGEFMDEKIVNVKVDEEIENVAKLFSKYKLLALPVVDSENRLIGSITVDDVFSEIIPDDVEKRKVRHKPKRHRHNAMHKMQVEKNAINSEQDVAGTKA